MNKEEIEKVYKYFELLKEIESISKEIEKIITENSDVDMYSAWFVNIVELEKYYDENREEYYLYDGEYNAYQQNNYFLWQVTEYEDSFYGCIYYPLENNKYLQINYGF